MSDYTSEEIQEVYRKQREYLEANGYLTEERQLNILRCLNRSYKNMVEQCKAISGKINSATFNNWNTNERA